MTPEPAREEDFDAVMRLLEGAALPTAGVRDHFPARYVVIRERSEVVGVAGLERYASAGLLRSLAVPPHRRRGGLGRVLVEHQLATAQRDGLEAVYLLTTTAPDFFRRLGFVDTPRADVPESVRRAPEFASICPGSATCLVRVHRA